MNSPFSSPLPRDCSRNSGVRGFTLIEMLTVLAITAVMAGLILPALTSLGKSNALNVSADVVVNMANLGRETSMSKNAMTALIVLTDSSLDGADRIFGLMELDPRSDGSQPQSTDWKQVSKWESINSGVISDPSSLTFNKSTDAAGTAGVPTPSFPPIVYNGRTVSNYSYVIFLPGGNLLSGTSPQLQLVEGNVSSGTVTYTRPVAGGGAPANYYSLTVLTSTGRVKVDRPLRLIDRHLMSHHRKISAFALVEVVLALAVASVSLIAIIALLSVAASSSKASSDDTLVATMAVSVIDDMSRLFFVDYNPLAPHVISDANVLPGTSDVATGTTPAVVSPAPQVFFDVAGVRLKYGSGLDMIKSDAIAAGAVYQCTETLQGDVNTLSATGTDGSTSTQAINLMNVILTFTWPVQAANPPNSKTIYASLARY